MKSSPPFALLGVTLAILGGTGLIGFFRNQAPSPAPTPLPTPPVTFVTMRAALVKEKKIHFVTTDDATRKTRFELWIDGERFRQETEQGVYAFDGKQYWKRVKGATVALVGENQVDISPIPADPIPISLEITPYLSKLYGTQDDGVLRYLVSAPKPNRLTLSGSANNTLATIEVTLDPETSLPLSEARHQVPDPPTEGQPRVAVPPPPESHSTTIAFGRPPPVEGFSPPESPPPFDVSQFKRDWKATQEAGNLGTLRGPGVEVRLHRVEVNRKGQVALTWSGKLREAPSALDETGAAYEKQGLNLPPLLLVDGVQRYVYRPMRPLVPGTIPQNIIFSLPGANKGNTIAVDVSHPTVESDKDLGIRQIPPAIAALEPANRAALGFEDAPSSGALDNDVDIWFFRPLVEHWARSPPRKLTAAEVEILKRRWERVQKALPPDKQQWSAQIQYIDATLKGWEKANVEPGQRTPP